MMEVERAFVLEVILNREPTDEEEGTIVDAAAQASKANKFYRETRNFLITTFRQNPRVYLSLTSVRKMVNVSFER